MSVAYIGFAGYRMMRQKLYKEGAIVPFVWHPLRNSCPKQLPEYSQPVKTVM